MHPTTSHAIRPHLVLVLLLFGATIVAPRGWQAVAVVPISLADAHGRVAAPPLRDLPPGGLAAAYVQFTRAATLELPTHLHAAEQIALQSGRKSPSAPIRLTQTATTLADQPASTSTNLTRLTSTPQARLTPRDLPKLDHSRVAPVPRLHAAADQLAGRSASQTNPATPPELQSAVWPLPTALVRQLEQMQSSPQWRSRVLDGLQQLAGCRSLHGQDAAAALATLESLETEVGQLATSEVNDDRRAELLRAQYALRRRLDIWLAIQRAAIQQVGAPLPSPSERTWAADHPLSDCLAAVEQQLALLSERNGWREFLMLDQLRSLVEAVVTGPAVDVASPAAAAATPAADVAGPTAKVRDELALEVLRRMDDPGLTEQQRRLLENAEFVRLAEFLRTWGGSAVDITGLLERLERFELGETSLVAAELARDQQLLARSSDPGLAEIGQLLDMHYRNANTRLVVTDEFLQRFMPQNVTQRERIRDVVAGAPVVGRGRTRTNLFVRLTPHASRWQMGIEAVGEVATDTRSKVGPATFYNQGRSHYRIRKPVVVDALGIRTRPATGVADTQSELSGLETDFDAIPLIGLIVQATAQRRYEEQLPGATREVRAQVAQTASDRLDEEVRKRLDETDQQFNSKLLAPLHRLQLRPTPLELSTRSNAITGRFRLAGDEQLAAFTPRPRALSHSLMTLQVHESAVNNGLQSLRLEGMRRDLPSLFREVAAAVGQPDAQVPEDLQREDAVIHFADEEPLRVRFADERMEITLRLAALEAPDRQPWRELVVRAFYRPVLDERHAAMERDGYIQLSGARLRLRDQVVLRGIFSKMFPRHPELNKVSQEFMQRPQLTDTQVEQFIIRDGWIGLAITPQTQVAAGNTRQQGGTRQ